MRFTLMMHAPGTAKDYKVNEWGPDDFKAHIAFMHRLNQELTQAGELVGDRPGRAYEIAAKASTAPGPGGEPLVILIEVRQVMGAPPDQS